MSSSADFTCSICFETASEPVVTRCGHLFCWSCLESWLHSPQAGDSCPVCKGRVDEHITGDVIPLYGKGKPAANDRRPPPARSAPAPTFSAQTTPPRGSSTPHGPRPAAPRAPTPPTRLRGQGFAQRASPLMGGTFLIFGGNMWLALICIAVWGIIQFTPWRRWTQQLTDAVTSRSSTTEVPPQRAPPNRSRSQPQAAPIVEEPPRQVLVCPERMVRNLAISMLALTVLVYLVNAV